MRRFMACILLIVLSGFLFAPAFAHAAASAERGLYGFWGLGPNLSPLGNVRIGYHNAEVGIISGTGIGAAYLFRSSSAFFAELGGLVTPRGFGVMGGIGGEWPFWSYFALRAEITSIVDETWVSGGAASIGLVIGY